MYNNKRFTMLIPVMMVIILITGIFIGNFMKSSYRHENNYSSYDINSNKLNLILDLIEMEYVDSVSKDDLVERAIPSVLETLDPHSVYIPAENLKEQNESLHGNFEGIGVEFNIQNDTLLIVNTISGGPSEKVGIRAGDRIITVNDTVIAGIKITNKDVIRKLKGPKGTKVWVGIKRWGERELLDFEIVRDKIPIFSIDVAYKISNDMGYIKISSFSRTTYKEFVDAVENLKKNGIKKLIVDLRENPGGYLDIAYKIIDEFLTDRTLVVYTQGNAREKQNYYASSNKLCADLEVGLIIDEWSASASEIFAGAIQDNDRGVIFGRRSFGKGLVQEPREFRDGSAIRLTIARYYTPSGRCIQKPYDSGVDAYRNDLTKRFSHGEFMEKDSIKLSDSLEYQTKNGRKVYGGGGVMPDVFIPRDTVGYTPYFKKISEKNLTYNFALKFTESKRAYLNTLQNYKVLTEYLDREYLFEQFTDYAARKGVTRNIFSTADSDHIIKTQLYAYIARNIFDDKGFYPIIKDIDNMLLKTIEIMSDTEKISKILQKKLNSESKR